jgi:valyl-tRNA synthetase
VLDASLRALHPLMPFATEDLWQRLPHATGRAVSIALARFPTRETDGAPDATIDREMEALQAVITAARTVRSEHELTKEPLPLEVRTDSAPLAALLEIHAPAVEVLVRTAGPVVIGPLGADRPKGSVVTTVTTSYGVATVIVGLRGLVAPEKELARIERELRRIDKDLAVIDKKLASPGFLDRAPKEVVEETRRQRAALAEARERLVAARTLVSEL